MLRLKTGGLCWWVPDPKMRVAGFWYLTVATGTLLLATASACPPGFNQNGDYCFKSLPTSYNWSQARTECAKIDANLPLRRDQKALDALNAYAPNNGPNNIWTGITNYPVASQPWYRIDTGATVNCALLGGQCPDVGNTSKVQAVTACKFKRNDAGSGFCIYDVPSSQQCVVCEVAVSTMTQLPCAKLSTYWGTKTYTKSGSLKHICSLRFSSTNMQDFIQLNYTTIWEPMEDAYVYTVHVPNVTVPIYHLNHTRWNPATNLAIVGKPGRDLLLKMTFRSLVGIIGYGLPSASTSQGGADLTPFYAWWSVEMSSDIAFEAFLATNDSIANMPACDNVDTRYELQNVIVVYLPQYLGNGYCAFGSQSTTTTTTTSSTTSGTPSPSTSASTSASTASTTTTTTSAMTTSTTTPTTTSATSTTITSTIITSTTRNPTTSTSTSTTTSSKTASTSAKTTTPKSTTATSSRVTTGSTSGAVTTASSSSTSGSTTTDSTSGAVTTATSRAPTTTSRATSTSSSTTRSGKEVTTPTTTTVAQTTPTSTGTSTSTASIGTPSTTTTMSKSDAAATAKSFATTILSTAIPTAIILTTSAVTTSASGPETTTPNAWSTVSSTTMTTPSPKPKTTPGTVVSSSSPTSSDPSATATSLQDTAATLSTQQLLEYFGLYASNDSTARVAMINSILPYLTRQLSPETIRQIGMQWSRIFIKCYYEETSCLDDKDLQMTYSASFGSCYTFNYNSTHPRMVRVAGRQNGLKLILVADQEEYICTSASVGFRLSLQQQSDDPFPEATGFYVSPGAVTSVVVSRHALARIDNCINWTDKNEYFYNGSYRVEGCLRTCFQRYALSYCGCADPRFAKPSRVSYCSEATCLSYLACGEVDILKEMGCRCLPPCLDVSYDTAVTLSEIRLDSPIFADACRQIELMSTNTTRSCADFIRKNVAIVEIFFSHLTEVSYYEASAYSVDFLAETFNLLNLMINVSGILVVEVIILAVNLVIPCCELNRKVRVIPTKRR